jgi:APA family basic amino acid/polyamine antiporter
MILIGFLAGSKTDVIFRPTGASFREIVSPAFAISLFFVSFAYSGWNAAAYIAGEIRDPARNIPLSLIPGTMVVTLLYLGITWVFLKIIPIELMQGRIEIGYLYGQKIFGEQAGNIMGILFGFLLFSTVSSLIITGPRVSQVMGEDYRGIRWFASSSRQDTPARAIYVQGLIAVVYLLSSTFEQMITYIGFTLNLMTFLTVLGMMILRKRNPANPGNTYRIRLYPYIPLVFLIINSWIMIYGFIYRPFESLAGVLTAGTGMVLWFILRGGSVQPREGS